MAGIGIHGGTASGGSGGLVVSDGLALRFEDTGSNILYLAEAQPGTLDAAAGWRITRITTSAGVVFEWADGDDAFDNVWDDRASLAYS